MEQVTTTKSRILYTITLESSKDDPIKIHTKTVEVDDIFTAHYVRKVTQGGKLLNCGLQRGDKLDSINDHSVLWLDRKELKMLLKREVETGQVKLDVFRKISPSAEPVKVDQKLGLTLQQKSVPATNNFIKEYSVTIEAGEKFGYERTTYRHGGLYTHQITKVRKDKPLDRAVNVSSVLRKEIVSVNGKYTKTLNDSKLTQLISGLMKLGGTVVFGILDDSNIVTNDGRIANEQYCEKGLNNVFVDAFETFENAETEPREQIKYVLNGVLYTSTGKKENKSSTRAVSKHVNEASKHDRICFGVFLFVFLVFIVLT